MSRYYKILLPDTEYICIYFTNHVEKILKDLIEGNSLRAIFVRAEDLEYASLYEDYWDFTIMGGEILVSFNDFTLGLIIHAEGLMKYNIYPEISKLEAIPLDIEDTGKIIRDKSIFYDLGDTFRMDFGLIVENCEFETTDTYPFSSSWDRELLENSKLLPKKIKLETEFLDVSFCGSLIEYFYIDLNIKV